MISKNLVIGTLSILALSTSISIYFLSHYISLPFLLLSSMLFLYFLIRKAIYISIYPGSNWFWRRSLEVSYCKDLSFQVFEKNSNLQSFLQLLLQQSTQVTSFDLSNFSALMDSIIEVFTLMPKKSYHQKKLFNSLLELKENLNCTKLIINDNEEFNAYDWLKITKNCSNVNKIVLDDCSKRSAAFRSLHSSKSLELVLRSCFESKNWVSSAYRWLFNDSLGSINFMRIDLYTRYSSEPLRITANNHSIDCIFISSGQPNSSIVVFCNPNAAYYEFFYFQSDWIEFYLSRGISLFLWNYPGYGSTKGSAHIKNFIKAGVVVVEYVKANYTYNKLAIHGESLGGCVAVHVAQTCGCDFLLADRTFSSLADVFLFKYGHVPYYLFKITCHSDIELIDEYLSIECNKVIVVASNDEVICDLASLKSGVAFKIFNKSKEFIRDKCVGQSLDDVDSIIPWRKCEELLEALGYIVRIWDELVDVSTKEEIKGHLRTDQAEENDVKGILQSVVNVLEEVQAGGVSLASIPRKSMPKVQIQIWLMVLDLWGGSCYEEVSSMLIKFVGELKLIVSVLKDTNDQELWKNIDTVGKVLDSLASTFLERSLKKHEATEEILINLDLKKTGSLIPVACGHSGFFNQQEQENYTKKLSEAGLI